MKEIPLTRGKVALVDDEDYDRVMAHQWWTSPRVGRSTFYAYCDLSGTIQSLHRFIMRPPKGKQVDHINRNGLDCRRANMRNVTGSENQRNVPKRANNTSGFKGVVFHKGTGKWQAQFQTSNNGVRKNNYIGLFMTPSAAAEAYDKVVSKMFGPLAALNFPIKERVLNVRCN